MRETYIQLLVFGTLFLVSSSEWAIPEVCESVQDIYVRENVQILGSTAALDETPGANRVHQCWRVTPISYRPDRVLKLSIEKIITKPTEVTSNSSGCAYGLFIMEGIEYNMDAVIAERCSVGMGEQLEHVLVPFTVHSIQPYVFIRYYNKLADPPEVWMTLNAEIASLSDVTQDCLRLTLGKNEHKTLNYYNFTETFQRDTFQCWLINAANNETNMLEFNFEDLGILNRGNGECNDKIEMYSWDMNNTENIYLLDRVCIESFKTQQMYFTDRTIYVRFVTNSVQQMSGFEIQVRNLPRTMPLNSCIEVQMTPSSAPKTISTPNYPMNYGNNMDMCWKISMGIKGNNIADAISKFAVSVVTKKFQLDPDWGQCGLTDEDTNEVLADRVDFIPEGNGGNSSLSVCGTVDQKNAILFSSLETFFIRFRSNLVFTNSGFQMMLVSEPSNCQEMLINTPVQHSILATTEETGTTGMGMCWRLTTKSSGNREDFADALYEPNAAYSFLVFVEDLQLNENGDCNTDYLHIYDGQSQIDSLLYSECGGKPLVSNRTTVVLYSSGNHVYIRYRASAQSTTRRISVRTLYTGLVQSIKQQGIGMLTNCQSRIIEANSMGWKSVNLDDVSSVNGIVCQTFRVNGTGYKLQMKVNYRHTSFKTSCSERFVSIYGDESTAMAPVINICDDIEGFITAPENGFTLVAYTSYPRRENIRAWLDIVEADKFGNSCIDIPIGDEENAEYIVTTPNYPHLYPPNTDVCWQAYLLKPDSDKRIVFQVQDIYQFPKDECEQNQTGTNDTISVWNDHGQGKNSTLCDLSYFGWISKACPESEYVTVRFKSDDILSTRGFVGFFKVVKKRKICDHDNFWTLYKVVLISMGSLLFLILLCAFVHYCCTTCCTCWPCCGKSSVSDSDSDCEICGGPVEKNEKYQSTLNE